MSTQDDSGISFEISNEQQYFRLLELPPSLLELITSKDPPNLWLKSAEASIASDGSKQSSPNAVLCTDEHTFQLRQVQSSNSVFILQPSESRRGDNEITSPSLSAIAQCASTLELIPSDTAASAAMVSRLLKESLPFYEGLDTDMESGTNITSARNYKDKNAILHDAPLSAVEFDKAWKQLCAFEANGRAWLPTPSALAMLWKSIQSAASVRGLKLEKTFDPKSLAEVVGDDGYPWALLLAVIARLVSDTDPHQEEYVTLSRDKTIQWVGSVFLERAGDSGLPQSEFLVQWHDVLPEGWRKHASMDLLKATYSLSGPSKEKIVFSADIYKTASLETLPSANAGGKANRNWHDKFRAGRK